MREHEPSSFSPQVGSQVRGSWITAPVVSTCPFTVCVYYIDGVSKLCLGYLGWETCLGVGEPIWQYLSIRICPPSLLNASLRVLRVRHRARSLAMRR